MGGSSSPISKAVKSVKKSVKKAGDVAGFVFNPAAAVAGKLSGQATGSKTFGKVVQGTASPGSFTSETAGSLMIDKPKQMKKEFEKAKADAESAQAAQLKRIEGRRAQEGAEKMAADELLSRRARQRRRRSASGRESTVLAKDLGNVGGTGRKNLLGL